MKLTQLGEELSSVGDSVRKASTKTLRRASSKEKMCGQNEQPTPGAVRLAGGRTYTHRRCLGSMLRIGGGEEKSNRGFCCDG